ncbi:MAG: YhdH/YhfP family quinone oxidoreductase [Desulfatirhabdiaceae bacterium]
MQKPQTFKAMMVRSETDSPVAREIILRSIDDLPPGDVLIQVHYSSLNYKDALSASGNRGVTRNYPHTPGIDAAGIVMDSAHPDFVPGDMVLVTGYDLGMNTSGGFGQYIRVPTDWVVKLPGSLSLKESMAYGTAGFTASLCVFKMITHGLKPEDGNILVTGASGGVGSMAVSILAKLGYSVTAASGKPEMHDYLTGLGARSIVSREEIQDLSDRPLLKARWIGVVDTVGGGFLATALKSTMPHACITACGNVASPLLNTTVFPFILRGITLYGIDSAGTPMTLRKMIWEKIASEWKIDHMERLYREISLEALDANIDRMLHGQQTGRIVVNLQDDALLNIP